MTNPTFIDNAKVMSKGQITIPKDIRDMLGVSCGDRVTFIVEGNSIRIVNSAVYAMKLLQSEMKDISDSSVSSSDDDYMDIVKEVRLN